MDAHNVGLLAQLQVGRDGRRLALHVDDLQVVDCEFQVVQLLGVDLFIRLRGLRNHRLLGRVVDRCVRQLPRCVAAGIVVQDVLALALLVGMDPICGKRDPIVLDMDLLEVHRVHPQQVPLNPVVEFRGDLAGIDIDDVDGILVRITDIVLIALVNHRFADDQGGQGLAFLVLQSNPRADARIARLDRFRIGIDDAVLVVQPANVVLVEFPCFSSIPGAVFTLLMPMSRFAAWARWSSSVGRIVEMRGDGPRVLPSPVTWATTKGFLTCWLASSNCTISNCVRLERIREVGKELDGRIFAQVPGRGNGPGREGPQADDQCQSNERGGFDDFTHVYLSQNQNWLSADNCGAAVPAAR